MTKYKPQGIHRKLYIDNHGPLPWTCYFCKRPITIFGRTKDAASVHHIDHDHDNNDLSNLTSVHIGCHLTHHNHLRVIGEKQLAFLRTASTGLKRPCPEGCECRRHDPDVIAGAAHKRTGLKRGPMPQERRDKISAAKKAGFARRRSEAGK